MIGVVAALLVAASLTVGLRATSGWLDHWHPIDRLALAVALGVILIAATLLLSDRFGIAPAGFGLAFALAPVGIYDATRWWFRSRLNARPWLVGTSARPWILVIRWAVVIGTIAAIVFFVWSPVALSRPQ